MQRYFLFLKPANLKQRNYNLLTHRTNNQAGTGESVRLNVRISNRKKDPSLDGLRSFPYLLV